MRSLLTASVLTCTTLLTWTAALLLLPSTDAHRGCVHNKVVQKRPHRVPQPLGGRRSSGWDPIRIEFDTSGIDAAVPSDTKAYIEELVAECKLWLQAALKVHRLQGNLVLTAQDGVLGAGCGADQASIPSKYASAGGGVAADLVIFVLSQPTSQTCADGNTLAYASHCRQDSQTDRPIAGYIQMCPQHHARKTIKSQRDEDFHTALHEILHIMGWSSALFPFFRSSDGQPITPRCGDPSDSQWLPAGAKAYAVDPSSFSDSDFALRTPLATRPFCAPPAVGYTKCLPTRSRRKPRRQRSTRQAPHALCSRPRRFLHALARTLNARRWRAWTWKMTAALARLAVTGRRGNWSQNSCRQRHPA